MTTATVPNSIKAAGLLLLTAVLTMPPQAAAQAPAPTNPGSGSGAAGTMQPGQPGMGKQGAGSMSGSMSGSMAGMHQKMMGSSETMQKSMASATSEAAKAYVDAMMRMHDEMAIVYSNDADIDFARGMIAHHRGAIEMAEVQLKYGKDEANRKLATKIIADQRAEIAQMEQWLKARNAPSGAEQPKR